METHNTVDLKTGSVRVGSKKKRPNIFVLTHSFSKKLPFFRRNGKIINDYSDKKILNELNDIEQRKHVREKKKAHRYLIDWSYCFILPSKGSWDRYWMKRLQAPEKGASWMGVVAFLRHPPNPASPHRLMSLTCCSHHVYFRWSDALPLALQLGWKDQKAYDGLAWTAVNCHVERSHICSWP